MRSTSSIFTQVNYAGFRAVMAQHLSGNVNHGGYETVICDSQGLPLAIVHAASIDERGRSHRASYFVRTDTLAVSQDDRQAA